MPAADAQSPVRGRSAKIRARIDTDLERIKLLVGLGYQVSVTGGLNPEHIQLFKDFPVYSFIIGRSLYEAKDPTQMALSFQHEINRIFG